MGDLTTYHSTSKDAALRWMVIYFKGAAKKAGMAYRGCALARHRRLEWLANVVIWFAWLRLLFPGMLLTPDGKVPGKSAMPMIAEALARAEMQLWLGLRLCWLATKTETQQCQQQHQQQPQQPQPQPQ